MNDPGERRRPFDKESALRHEVWQLKASLILSIHAEAAMESMITKPPPFFAGRGQFELCNWAQMYRAAREISPPAAN
jgi:hypothetical protein